MTNNKLIQNKTTIHVYTYVDNKFFSEYTVRRNIYTNEDNQRVAKVCGAFRKIYYNSFGVPSVDIFSKTTQAFSCNVRTLDEYLEDTFNKNLELAREEVAAYFSDDLECRAWTRAVDWTQDDITNYIARYFGNKWNAKQEAINKAFYD